MRMENRELVLCGQGADVLIGPNGYGKYAGKKYRAEKDPNPKATLNELTEISNRLDRVYGHGSTELARDFVEDYWDGAAANIDLIKGQCPPGFGAFEKKIVNQFRRRSTR